MTLAPLLGGAFSSPVPWRGPSLRSSRAGGSARRNSFRPSPWSHVS